ncbi:hypothetical protein K488DRAFT_86758 [Vararia minispora EC-137]|uniref:Uncharacterized protein n=1 Tax=Vararia minispora EC-137 TaxID=1314806 RepID=A0ACB8QIH7_9AGAM|nr:hypothetical protein K488DRAFT_86758 [Vararia minispora EC-137]
MSGKDPPRGPRALLNSLAGSEGQQRQLPPSSLSTLSTPQLNGSSRLGAPPPTGPRSLLINSGGGRGPAPKPAPVNGQVGALVNGQARAPIPTGPKTVVRPAARQVEIKWTASVCRCFSAVVDVVADPH